MISIPLDTFQTMMINHVRYCLPRHSYIVSECIDDVKTHWQQLSDNTKTIIKDDITQYINDSQKRLEREDFSDEMKAFLLRDLEDWQLLQEWLILQECLKQY